MRPLIILCALVACGPPEPTTTEVPDGVSCPDGFFAAPDGMLCLRESDNCLPGVYANPEGECVYLDGRPALSSEGELHAVMCEAAQNCAADAGLETPSCADVLPGAVAGGCTFDGAEAVACSLELAEATCDVLTGEIEFPLPCQSYLDSCQVTSGVTLEEWGDTICALANTCLVAEGFEEVDCGVEPGACDFDASAAATCLAELDGTCSGAILVMPASCDEVLSNCETEVPDDCVSGILETVPSLNDSNVFFATTVEVEFNQPESTTSTLVLVDAAGSMVPGSVAYSSDGERAIFTPAAPLQPSTDYELAVSYSCNGSLALPFRTSSVGSAVSGSSVLGRTYVVDPSTVRILEPAGLNGLVVPFLADLDSLVVVSPTAYNAPNMQMRLAVAFEDGGLIEQDLCRVTQQLRGVDYTDNPLYRYSSSTLTVSATESDILVHDYETSAAFSPDGDSIVGIASRMTFDMRDVDGESLGVGDQRLCDVMAQLGVSCVACVDGELDCLVVVTDSMVAEREYGLDLVEVTASDIASNPDCTP